MCDTPGASQHDQAQEHDPGILQQTPTTTHPVTNDTNEDLTDDYTDDFEVGNSVDPLLITNFVTIPASRERMLKEGGDVSDGQENVTVARALERTNADQLIWGNYTLPNQYQHLG